MQLTNLKSCKSTEDGRIKAHTIWNVQAHFCELWSRNPGFMWTRTDAQTMHRTICILRKACKLCIALSQKRTLESMNSAGRRTVSFCCQVLNVSNRWTHKPWTRLITFNPWICIAALLVTFLSNITLPFESGKHILLKGTHLHVEEWICLTLP